MAAPFLLGFGPAATAISVALGALLLGLALQLEGPSRNDPALRSRRGSTTCSPAPPSHGGLAIGLNLG